MITGESLHAFTGGYEFVTNFKKDVDTYSANLGLVYADDDPEQKGTHLDQELLIADRNTDGGLAFFSPYGMATHSIHSYLEAEIFFEETVVDDDIVLTFKNPRLKQAFIGMRDELVEGYATLLAFADIYKRLSAIYGVDLGYQVEKWLVALGGYIDQHNEALRKATGETDNEDGAFRHRGPILKIDEGLFIDKDKIKPSRGKVLVYFEKLNELFGSEFGSYEEVSDEDEERNL